MSASIFDHKSKGHLCFIRVWEFYRDGQTVRASKTGELIDLYTKVRQCSHHVCYIHDWPKIKEGIESGKWYIAGV